MQRATPTRIVWIGWLALSLLFPATTRSETPNIVLIMADDLGWMDLACQGNRLVETLHLDRLATQGMRFTNAYAAASVCSPTRAAILTGKSPARLQLTNHIPDQPRFTPPAAKLLSAPMLDHLPLSECSVPVVSMVTYPTLLGAAGIPPHDNEPPDGKNLLPLLTETGSLSRDAIYFHFPNYAWHGSNRLGSAIRSDPYKLIEFFEDDSLELYDLTNDLSETHNLATEKPELASQLQQRLATWRQEAVAAMPRQPDCG